MEANKVQNCCRFGVKCPQILNWDVTSFSGSISSSKNCHMAHIIIQELPEITRKCPNMSQYVPCWEHLLINLHRHLRSVSEKMGTSIWVNLLRRSAFRHGISGICNHQEDVSRASTDEENCDNHQISGTGNPKMLLNPKKNHLSALKTQWNMSKLRVHLRVLRIQKTG